MNEKCIECNKPATHIRTTQFSGDHPYCLEHAEAQLNFNEDDSYSYWTEVEKEEYDVVIDVLQRHRDKLWKMTRSNMNNDMMNIMDDIRLEQISQLEKAIAVWKSVSSQVG